MNAKIEIEDEGIEEVLREFGTVEKNVHGFLIRKQDLLWGFFRWLLSGSRRGPSFLVNIIDTGRGFTPAVSPFYGAGIIMTKNAMKRAEVDANKIEKAVQEFLKKRQK